jgi:hypothetical protein
MSDLISAKLGETFPEHTTAKPTKNKDHKEIIDFLVGLKPKTEAFILNPQVKKEIKDKTLETLKGSEIPHIENYIVGLRRIAKNRDIKIEVLKTHRLEGKTIAHRGKQASNVLGWEIQRIS